MVEYGKNKKSEGESVDGIGKIIFEEREKAGISQNELCEGICSVATLSRLEWTEQNIGKWNIDAFLQRLGKSQDKFWTIVHIGDYEIMELRRKIWNYILYGDYDKAEEEIQRYEANVGIEKLHEQFVKKCQGMIKGKRDNDWEGALQLFNDALKATVPDFCIEKVKCSLMGRDEMQIVLLIAESYSHLGEEKIAIEMTENLLENIRKKEWDEEEVVKIYPKVVRVYDDFLKKEDRYEDVITLSQRAADMLVENGIIFLLKELLEQIMWGMEERRSVEGRRFTIREEMDYAQYKKQVMVLKELWEEYGDLPEEAMLYCTNVQKDVSVSNEIIAKCRKLCKLSQEKVSEDVCTVEQYSRIETGKCSPKEKSYRALMEKMNQAQERNRFFINAQEYSMHEKIRTVEKLISGQELKKALVEWKKIRKEISNDTLNNQQYIARYDAFLNGHNKTIGFEEHIQQLEDALRITMPEFETVDIKNWPLSRNEIFLLANIASGYYTIGEKKKAREIYYALWNYIEESNIDKIYCITEYRLLSYNIGLMEGMEHNYCRAKEILNYGIRSCMMAGRDEMLPSFLYCLGWVIREEGKLENEKEARYILEQAFFLADMLRLPNLCNKIYNYYEEEWNDKILYQS